MKTIPLLAASARIVATFCLLLALPGCMATNFVQDKMNFVSSQPPPPPSYMRDTKWAGRSADGTVALCISGYPKWRTRFEWTMEFTPRFRPDAGRQSLLPDRENGTDQPASIPRKSIPAKLARRGCSSQPIPIPIYDMTAEQVSLYPYKGYDRDDPYPAAYRWRNVDGMPRVGGLSDERFRKKIHDRIIADEAPAGIYRVAVMLPDGERVSSVVFYKHNSPISGNARVVQLEISGNTPENLLKNLKEYEKDKKTRSSWSLLLPPAFLFDTVTLPVQAIGYGVLYAYFSISMSRHPW